MYKISSYLALLGDDLVPAETCVLRCKYPVGILGMQLSQAVLVALGKSLLIEIVFKIRICGISHRLPYVIAPCIALSSGKTDLVPYISVASRLLRDYSYLSII